MLARSSINPSLVNRSSAQVKPGFTAHARLIKAQANQYESPHGVEVRDLCLSRRSMFGLPLLGVSLATLAYSEPALALGDNAMRELYSIAETVDWAAVKSDILDIIKDESVPGSGIGEKGPTLMLHDGGSGGATIRFKEELAHGANAGLDKPVSWLEPVHAKYPALSYADLYTYAGAVAVEAMGGPKIGFRAGRVDALSPDAVTPDGRLPDADKGSPPATAAALRETFGRMGFNDQEIVALSGAHALGRCHAENSGYVGPWQATPTIFSNIYYILLKKVNWTPNESAAKFQFQDPDEEFKKYVDVYAKDKAKFYNDFAIAFQKLEELGTSGLVSVA
eukprot:gene1270-32618_t